MPLALALGLPLLLSVALIFAWQRSRLDWLLFSLLCCGVSVYMYLASPIWPWIGFGWRFLPLAVVVAAVLWSVPRLRACDSLPPAKPRPLAGAILRGVAVALLAAMLIDLRIGHIAPAGAIELTFPLKSGRFAVLQGGDTAALNGHRGVPAQAYAIDVVALNEEGRRARGVRPETFESYEIYDRPVSAPCDGVVSGTADGAPDTPIGGADPLRPAGNHVLLSCVADGGEVTLLLAHFRPGSVAVVPGERVRRGAFLGRVGNSGNSTEPHLHLHAVRGREADLRAAIATAEAVPLILDGRFLTRNDIIRVPDRP